MNTPDWLPQLVKRIDYENDWTKYIEAIYQHFKQCFIDNRTQFRGEVVAVARGAVEGKETTFWHMISEGSDGPGTLDDVRCERICWPKPIIEECDNRSLKVWQNKRGSEDRLCILVEEGSYLVVLMPRTSDYKLLTAYVVEGRRKAKLLKEHEQYTKRV